MRTNYQNLNFVMSVKDEDTIVDRKVWIKEAAGLVAKPQKMIEGLVKQWANSEDGIDVWPAESVESAIWEALERDGFYVEVKDEEPEDDLPLFIPGKTFEEANPGKTLPEEGEVKFSDVSASLEVDEDEDCVDTSVPMWKLREARKHYVKTKEGKKTHIDCGDELAAQLRNLSLEDVYQFASSILVVDVAELKAKYGHLNNGQQRMNLGNRLRYFLKAAA